ncbi:unnamed protein product [Lupinus luteus]|uniref:non-specific serine/threonine protein kinase n=1 Tax=Lupinus luteus TaxID=3873 RepID=A0AAV1X8J1_LUPLU
MVTTKSPSSAIILAVTTILTFSLLLSSCHALGSATTLAVSDASATVCGVVASQPAQRIECYRSGHVINIVPNVSFSAISGGRKYFCGLRSGNYSLLCWDTVSSNVTFESRRLYNNGTVLFENLSVGDTQVCATTVGAGTNSSRVRCWGNGSIARKVESEFGNMSMLSIVAGDSHVCGLNSNGFLVCRGSNDFGQIDVPKGESFEYSGLALGAEHSCAIRRWNGSVVCWGGRGLFSVNVTQGVSFEIVVSGSNFTCGLTTNNFSVMCWGPGWSNSDGRSRFELPLSPILPGPCVQSSCSDCGIYPGSQIFCSGHGNICKPRPCSPRIPVSVVPPALPPSQASSPLPSKALKTALLAFAIVGSLGAVSGICTVIYCLWTGVRLGKKKVYNSVQPTITGGGSSNGGVSRLASRSSTIMRQGSRIMRRQRSGTSSGKHPDRAEEFTLDELAAATNNFSLENKIGGGSYGVVYKCKLDDGREVAIKRGDTSTKMKKFQEKECAFEAELGFLSRLHHKHLVRLVGYCQEKDERLLVYEYMKNGALYDHLHDKNNVDKNSSALNSWRMRIRIALDASRGIEYLHDYAVPSIIHRDIKSSNILIDANWTARVSDFGLSLMSPDSGHDCRPTKAAGTVGYIDPEYYGLNVLTAKSDVYGLGVVLLELLTGKRAIFKNGENGGTPMSVVDYAVPAIMGGELLQILDPRVELPELNETEAVELVAYTAMHCVNLEGKDRPTMADIVANLERALTLCDTSHGSISSCTISNVSE